MRFIALILFVPGSLTAATSSGEYWTKWHREAAEAKKCTNTSTTSKFLVGAINNLGNAERTEAYAEALEAIAIENPKCFLGAAAKLKPNSCKKIIRHFVDGAIYHEPSELNGALQSSGVKIPNCYGS